MQFYKLRISNIIRETPKAISVQFAVPTDLQQVFKFQAGQYITLQLTLDNNLVRRAYSISSTPHSNLLQVTIKATDNGYFSVFANENLKAGNIIEVAPPEGRFLMQLQESQNYMAIASGSGITPIMSMITTTLETTKNSKFYLIYGNKTQEQTIFYQQLNSLINQYPDRFLVNWFFSKEHQEDAIFGRIEPSKILYTLKNKWSGIDFSQIFLCGPEELINDSKECLQGFGVPQDKILFELFTSTINTPAPVSSGSTQLKVVLDDEETELTMTPGQTVLDAVLSKHLDAPYSCQGGICSSCIAKIKDGSATMIKNSVLTDSEIEQGLILTCQAQPTSSHLVIDYDDI